MKSYFPFKIFKLFLFFNIFCLFKVHGYDLPEKIVQDCSFNIEVAVSPPNIVSSRFVGSAGSLTETFNDLPIGNLPASGKFTIGTFNMTGNVSISSSTVSGGTSTPFLSIPNRSIISINLNQPSRYIGFWWGANNNTNLVNFYGYCGDKEVLIGSFSTADLNKLFSVPTVVAFDGNTYNSSDYRRTSSMQIFTYINIEFNDQNIDLTRLELIHTGTGAFEVDNITTFIKSVDLKITKTSLKNYYYEGDEIKYDLTVENLGITDAFEVQVEDNLLSGLQFISAELIEDNGIKLTTVVEDQKVIMIVSSLKSGQVALIRLTVKSGSLQNQIVSTILNSASVRSKERDSNLSDNISISSVQILPFFIPNVITPNNDRKNDEFVIYGLSKFASNELIIFDRWGSHIFQKKGYQNDWSGEGIASGTFFYILSVVDINGNPSKFKGWIQIIRE
jgi:gliding motility-associated-like protein/uncharacterized repeat protein (TIGR01451 family)